MVVDDHNFFMSLALEEAWKYQGLTYPNPAVGCCIVSREGAILAVEAHQEAGTPHAEINALQSAYFKLTHDSAILSLTISKEIHNYLLKNHNNLFHNVQLYTTLEPCAHEGKTPSCASLIAQLGIVSVYVGAKDTNPVAQAGNLILQESGSRVVSNVLQSKCEALLLPFQVWQKESFVFFKWAQRLNATTDAGNVSSVASRTHVHALRNVCDLLVIGGNSVRVDRPTLDARLVHGRAPDVLIISTQKEFDTTIPLFSVKGRKVFIESDFSKIGEYKNIMIEGSQKMFELSRNIVDLYLCYLAPTFGGKSGFSDVSENFEVLNIQKETQDIIMWMKRTEGNQ